MLWWKVGAQVLEGLHADQMPILAVPLQIARALLTEWASNPTPTTLADDASEPIKLSLNLGAYASLEEKVCAASDRKQVREIVEDAVGSGCAQVNTRFIRLVKYTVGDGFIKVGLYRCAIVG